MDPEKDIATVTVGKLLLLILAVVYFCYIVSVYRPFSFLDYDPGWQAVAVQSLVEDRDIDLKNQLHGNPKEAADQTALGVRGEWYPLHEWLMPLITVPFYHLFGLNGCLVVNALSMLALCLGAYVLALRYADAKAAFLAALSLGVTASCVTYAYSFSVDVFGAALAVWAVWAVFDNRPGLGGVLCGLAVLGRTTNAPLAVICLLYVLYKRYSTGSASILRFAAGAAPFALVFLWSNYHMFGTPLTVAYNRWARFSAGSVELVSQTANMRLPSLHAFAELVFKGEHSLWFMHPLGFFGFLFGWACVRGGGAAEKLVLYTVGAETVVLLASSENFPGGVGNRYLFTVCAFGTALLSCLLSYLFALAHIKPAKQKNLVE